MTGGGRDGAVRRGPHVVRARKPWTSTVTELLQHLETVGYAYSPRVVGGDEKEDVLLFIEGDPAPQNWSDQGIIELGSALRQLHDATVTFRPTNPRWQQDWWVRYEGADAIIGHGDPAPWNVLVRDQRPVAFVDWEFAGPVHRIQEVAHAAWLNCQLHDDDVAEQNGLLPAKERARQVRLFLDGYALPGAGRAFFVDRLVEVAVLSAANEAIDAAVTQETKNHPIALWALAWRARGAAWMIRNRSLLESAIL